VGEGTGSQDPDDYMSWWGVRVGAVDLSVPSHGLGGQTTFSDVPEDSWAGSSIDACFREGVVQGYPDGTYGPSGLVTRDQMAVYIGRALAGGEENVPEHTGDPSFFDVADDNWAYDSIEYVADQSVVQGYPGGYYQPGWLVTRDQMAVYIARSVVTPTGEAGLANYTPPDTPTFPDVPNTGYGPDGTQPFWAYKYIEYCVQEAIVSGYDDGCYHPEAEVTRDQMAVYITRSFGLIPRI
jgi:hypothetical protein